MLRKKKLEINPCPDCGEKRIWITLIYSPHKYFGKGYLECAKCHYCGKTKIGERRAIKSWNKEEKKVKKNNRLKSQDLCDRCRYSFKRHCEKHGCRACIMYGENRCICTTIRKNTPCPYFKEAED